MKLQTKRLKIRSLTTTATARTDDDVLLVSDAGGSWTLTLPPAANCINKVLQIKKTNSSSNTVTVDGNGAETIDGATTFAMKTQYEVLSIVSDGVNWQILFSNAGLLASHQNSGLRHVRGKHGGSGTLSGEGFSISTVTGSNNTRWRVTFDKAFAGPVSVIPSVCIESSASGSLFHAMVWEVTTTGFLIETILSSGVTAGGGAPWAFIAEGPK